MRILLTGATGLIGRRLVRDRAERGDDLVVVSRDAARAREVLEPDAADSLQVIEGNPMLEGPWQQAADGCDAAIHLAGASVAGKRWTRSNKALLVQSRIESTRQVVRAIAGAGRGPAVLICASATGYYGAAEDAVDESAGPGDDFLARLAARWEDEAKRAGPGARVVSLRIGIVLDERGGALQKMVPLFRLGLGGPLGSGRQFMPWIHWRDVAGLVDLALRDRELSGPINLVAPEALTNRVFSRTLGRVLRRPSWLPAPRLALRLAVGELADFMTMSQRVVPRKALDHGYDFVFPGLRGALEDLLPA